MSNDENTGGKDRTALRKKEEFNLSLRFVRAIERKVDQIKLREDKDKTFKLEDAEYKALMEINNDGLLQGAAAGLISFFLLRRIRSSLFRRFPTTTIQQQQQPPPKSPFQQHQPTTSTNATPNSSSVGSTPQQVVQEIKDSRGPGTFFNLFSYLVDGTLSFYIATYVSFRNPDPILQQMAALPLIEGKSTIATEFCPEFLQELRNVQNDIESGKEPATAREALQNPQTSHLRAVLQLCHNCQQRAAYEALLRQQAGLPDDEPVTVPPPGVPHTDMGSLGVVSGGGEGGSGWMLEDDTSSSSSGDFYDPSDQVDDSNNWADGFVTDQEDQKRKERERK
jgi:hypothetical protein